jgi:hypothetical protein
MEFEQQQKKNRKQEMTSEKWQKRKRQQEGGEMKIEHNKMKGQASMRNPFFQANTFLSLKLDRSTLQP